jgi:hypothetical protein
MLIGVWFVAPMNDLGYGGVKLIDAALIAAAGAVFLLTAQGAGSPLVLFVPRSARRVLLGLALLVAGLVVGQTRGGNSGGEIAEVAAYGVLATIPLLLIVRVRPSARLLGTLASAFVVGTCVSVLAGDATPQGRLTGHASHMNALAMTIVIALAFLPVAFQHWRLRVLLRIAAAALLLYGLNSTGSRSGLIGAAVLAAVAAATWVRARPQRFGALVAVVLLATPFVLSARIDEGSGALRRFVTQDETERSDEARFQKLEAGIAALSPPTALIGEGYPDEVAPAHNIILNVWIAGGFLAVSGLILAFTGPIVTLVRAVARTSRLPSSLTYWLSLGVCGYLVVAFFNNELWPRFIWAALALAVMADAGDKVNSPKVA